MIKIKNYNWHIFPLVLLGISSLLFFYSWWLHNYSQVHPFLFVGFIFAVFYGTFQIAFNWIIYLGINAESSNLYGSTENFTVDVFIPAYNEEFDLIVGCLASACSMRGEFKVWLLDDGNDSDLEKVAKRFGAGYLNRDGNKNAKAGNLNAALPYTQGGIIVIFDVDHLPDASFLEKILPYFSDKSVGFVQAIPTFYNNLDFGWVSRAAAETTFDFYTSTSRGMDGFKSVTKIGTNSLIRREALLHMAAHPLCIRMILQPLR